MGAFSNELQSYQPKAVRLVRREWVREVLAFIFIKFELNLKIHKTLYSPVSFPM